MISFLLFAAVLSVVLAIGGTIGFASWILFPYLQKRR
jgi:hypothetical protein